MNFKKTANRIMISAVAMIGLSTGLGMRKSTGAFIAYALGDEEPTSIIILGQNEEEENNSNIYFEDEGESEEVVTDTEETPVEEMPTEEIPTEETTTEEDVTEETELVTIEEYEIPTVMSIAPPSTSSEPLVYTSPTTENILGDASNWNGFVLGDITDCIDFEGSIAVAGDINSNRGLSVNGGTNGGSPVDTNDITLLVGGNLNLDCYGNVWGQTATGTSDGNTYNLTNVTPAGTTNNDFMIVDTAQYFLDAASALKQANQNVAGKTSNSTYTNDGYGSFDFESNPSEKELVYTVPESNFNGFNLNFNLSDGQTAVINLTSDQAIDLLNGSFSINGNSDNTYLRENAGRITINIVNSSELTMTSCELYGTLLAPNTNLIGDNASVCGIAIVNNLEARNGFEFHVGININVPINTPPVTTPPVTTPPVTTPPVTTPPTTTQPGNTPSITSTPNSKNPTPTPSPTEKAEIPEEAPKTGDESPSDLLLYAGFIGLAFGAGLKIDTNREDDLNNDGVIILKKRKQK